VLCPSAVQRNQVRW